MIMNILSWIAIGIFAFLFGFAAVSAFQKLASCLGPSKDIQNVYGVDLYIIMGLCLLTVYAQIFSIFYRVGMLALLGVGIGSILCLLFFLKDIGSFVSNLIKRTNLLVYIIAMLIIGVLVLVDSIQTIDCYDTYLYHAQSIHWLENYGVIKGLGNLHNRLAYNSSFFPLQALFTLKTFANQSLHSMNSFVSFVMLCYCIFGMKFWKNKMSLGDFFRLGIVIYYSCNLGGLIASDSTDLFALLMISYLISKFVDAYEKNVPEDAKLSEYLVLSLLAVYAVSLKLSAAMIVVLAFVPFLILINKKFWKLLGIWLLSGCAIIMPFLIRNIIISGYLLYPYPELDLFSVDWKMAEKTVYADRESIKRWAQQINGTTLSGERINEWFPRWFSNLNTLDQLLFVLSIISIVVGCIICVHLIKQKQYFYVCIFLTALSCFAFWFISAPLPRYGSLIMTVLPLFVIGYITTMKKWNGLASDSGNKSQLLNYVLISFMSVLIGIHIKGSDWSILSERYLKPADYEWLTCEAVDFYGNEIYVPQQGDQAGYQSFPSTPYLNVLEEIELRGIGIESGFRVK